MRRNNEEKMKHLLDRKIFYDLLIVHIFFWYL
jgi:hypothetical protein